MLYKMALSLAQSFYANSGIAYDEDDLEVYAYGLEVFITSVFELLAVVIIGLCVDRLFETIAFLIAFISLRSCAGGYHAKTVLRCFIGLLMVYALFLLFIYLIPFYLINFVSLFFVFLSAIPILKYAPLADANKPIGPIQRKLFRKKSIATCFFQVIIIISISCFGIFSSLSGEEVNRLTLYICLSFAIGQLTASGSIVAAKIRNAKGGGGI